MVSYYCEWSFCDATHRKIQCPALLSKHRHYVHWAPPTQALSAYCLNAGCCNWFLTFVLKFRYENRRAPALFEGWEEVKHFGNGRICLSLFGYTWFTVHSLKLTPPLPHHTILLPRLLALAWITARLIWPQCDWQRLCCVCCWASPPSAAQNAT